MRARPQAESTAIFRSRRTAIEAYHARWRRHDTLAHMHAEYQILLTLRGSGRYRYRGAWHDTGPGALLTFHPGEAHTIQPRGGWEFLALHVPTTQLAEDGERGEPVFTVSDMRPPEPLVRAFLGLCDVVRRAEATAGEIEAVDRFAATLAALRTEEDGAGAPRDAVVDAARAYLEQRLSDNVTLEALAARFGVHPTTLCRTFSRQVGIAPHAFHVQLRLREAQRLLRRGVRPTDVAAETGFADQSHFTRHFTRLTGLPPARYAQSVKNVQDARSERP